MVYQIYPRSFLDSDADGVGDLGGVRERLEYLAWLGVDAIWLSPIFPSPMRDFGYDVSDYEDVDPVFGTLEEFDALVREAHERGLRVILDWVPNHTSSDHPWFVDSRSSKESDHRDWYVWRDARADGSPPNNWVRAWSEESAWTWDEGTQQYYLHCFLEEQPDLNWENEAVRAAMHQTIRFWLDRGVDGLRMDVVHLLGKELDVDDPDELRGLSHVPLNDVAVTHDYLREIRAVFDEYDGDRVSIGEVYLFEPTSIATYYGTGDELHLSFNFATLFTPWRAPAWSTVISDTLEALDANNAWPTWVLSNHDNARVATRLGGDAGRVRSAMVLLLTLRGTPFLYAGEELGLLDAEIPVESRVDPGGRDGCRAPLPWTAEANHGWPVEPWLPFVTDAAQHCVATQRDDTASMLHFTRTLLDLRRRTSALRRGSLEALHVDEGTLRFDRVEGSTRFRVMVNFTDAPSYYDHTVARLVCSSSLAPEAGVVGPGEAVVLEVERDDVSH